MKNIIISEGHLRINRLICDYLVDKGHNVILVSDEESVFDFKLSKADGSGKCEVKKLKLDSEEEINELCKSIKEEYGNIDILIHGINELDDETLMEEDADEFGRYVRSNLRKIFLLTKSVADFMCRKKEGMILYPMIYDPLGFAGYPVSTVLNHSKISMMKCLAKELNAFKVRTNAITFGYYDDNFTKEDKKVIRNRVEIFGLKPKLNTLEEYISAIDIFIEESGKLISGQNIHIGTGMELFI